VVFGTIGIIYKFPPALVTAWLASFEGRGISTDYVPIADIKITQDGIEQKRWFYYQKYADKEKWCAGDFVAFDSFCKGDPIPNAAPHSPFQISNGSGAYNLQRGFRIPSTGKGGICGWTNVSKSSLTDAQIQNIERVLAMMRKPNGNYRYAP
jgi:hypothetical protein